MAMKILVDGREVRNQVARFVIVGFVALLAAVLFGVALLVLLPLIGIAVTVWLVLTGTLVAFIALLVAIALVQRLFTPRQGSPDIRDERRHIRDDK